ncbi:UDP-glucose 4-epimerase GalE [Actinotalea sp. Marseille-Q4924]|uniref:UDP-glucose 4-epimerase GalE n=1 Tax=Actinotalea sp. Marseille-Q4924 TaxID=2866571 RepID=UPI001CE42F0F|nr:UDP-glucose 4-epimerase GalE [Actinotalea sp. Marseille-Q4924]
MTVLVTGGAGYIGSHVVRLLAERGTPCVVVDDLSTGDAARVDGAALLRLDVAQSDAVPELAETMSSHGIRAVIHFAAKKRVDESVMRPAWYYQQNVSGLANVVMAMERSGADRLVFSSSAAVYGEPADGLVPESAPALPVNPYGTTKLVGEWLVRDAVVAGVLRGALALRYFNVAGAGWDDLGDPAVLNLVTMVLERLEEGRPPLVFGTDYPTADGSCVRDFVHVLDLARAHVAALDHLADETVSGFDVLNVGTGRGASVLEVVTTLTRLAGSDQAPVVRPRRPGDPAAVVAAAGRIGDVLGWRSEAELDRTLESAVTAWRHARGGGAPG